MREAILPNMAEPCVVVTEMHEKVFPQGAVPLCELECGQWGDIAWIKETHPFAVRFRDLGFSPGTRLFVRTKAPFRGPIEYELRGSRFCLRFQDAQDIFVVLAHG